MPKPSARVALFEPRTSERRKLTAALKKAGLVVTDTSEPSALKAERLVVLGPTLKGAARVASAVRQAREGVVLLSAQRTLKPAPHADGVLPLPISPRDLQARLPELFKEASAPSPRGLASATALVDPITGFYVFHHFKELLFVEVKRARRYGLALSVALIGVDAEAWKRAGKLRERLMAGLALAVRRSLRDTDYAVQFTEDRILLVMPHTELSGALVVCERIRERVSGVTLSVGKQELHPTVSIGVSSPEHGKELSFAELARRAQSCVTEAMHEGGNRVEFYDTAAPPNGELPQP